MLFPGLVHPHLEFWKCCWVSRFQKDRLLIEGVQRRATKLVPGLTEHDYSERLKSMDLPSMKYRRERGDMIETCKYIHGLYSVNNSLLKIDVETVTRGHKYKLKKLTIMSTCNYKNRTKHSLRQKQFAFRVVDSWNSLPYDVVDAPSLQVSKSRLGEIWQNERFFTEFAYLRSDLSV